MWRSPWLMMLLAALLVWWAARVVPQALGLNAASVNIGGTLQVAATKTTAFVTCTAPASFTGSVNVTCYNNTDAALSIVLTLTTLTPPSASMPLTSWNDTSVVKTVTLSVAAPGRPSPAQTLRRCPLKRLTPSAPM